MFFTDRKFTTSFESYIILLGSGGYGCHNRKETGWKERTGSALTKIKKAPAPDFSGRYALPGTVPRSTRVRSPTG